MTPTQLDSSSRDNTRRKHAHRQDKDARSSVDTIKNKTLPKHTAVREVRTAREDAHDTNRPFYTAIYTRASQGPGVEIIFSLRLINIQMMDNDQ
jgi:hypothetical protein